MQSPNSTKKLRYGRERQVKADLRAGGAVSPSDHGWLVYCPVSRLFAKVSSIRVRQAHGQLT